MSLRVTAAYMLAVLGGNEQPTAKDVKKILNAVGAEFEEEHITSLLDNLQDKNVNEVIDAGKKKLTSVPAGGAVASSGSSAATTSAPAETKKEEKKEESEEEEDIGFGGLF